MKTTTLHILLFCLLVLEFSSNAFSQFYTGSYQQFGKNRVQYVNFGWQYHDYEEFRVFYYGGERTNAEYVARSAYQHLVELEEFFDVELEEKIDIFSIHKIF